MITTYGHADAELPRVVISSVTDISTYIANENPGGFWGHDDLTAALVDAIRTADHPAYGSDWAEWLDAHLSGLIEAVVEASVSDEVQS